MKKINFDFENVGGLAECYAFPPTSFKRIRRDYIKKLNYLELDNRDDIIIIPMYANDTFVFNEEKSSTDGGDYWDVDIEGIIPKLCSLNADLKQKLERGEWLVLSKDNNDIVHLSGSVHVPLKFDDTSSSGTLYSDRNGTSFKFLGRQKAPSIIIEIDNIANI
jgi:hypothetical protein